MPSPSFPRKSPSLKASSKNPISICLQIHCCRRCNPHEKRCRVLPTTPRFRCRRCGRRRFPSSAKSRPSPPSRNPTPAPAPTPTPTGVLISPAPPMTRTPPIPTSSAPPCWGSIRSGRAPRPCLSIRSIASSRRRVSRIWRAKGLMEMNPGLSYPLQLNDRPPLLWNEVEFQCIFVYMMMIILRSLVIRGILMLIILDLKLPMLRKCLFL